MIWQNTVTLGWTGERKAEVSVIMRNENNALIAGRSWFRLVGVLAAAVLPLTGAAPVSAADIKKPNIVFILADDLGYTDVACFGSKYYETPNIDKLAREGVRFTSGQTCGPNCQPTRAALMSGQYMPRTGVYTVGGIDRFDWQSRPLK